MSKATRFRAASCSRAFHDRIDFYDQLNNRVVNFVPVPDLLEAVKWCDDTTQTVGVYPESVRDRILDTFSLVGVQRMVPLDGRRSHADLRGDAHTTARHAP